MTPEAQAPEIAASEPATVRSPALPSQLTVRVQAVIVLSITVLVYANSLFNGFTMDDELYIQHNPQVTEHTAKLIFAPNVVSNVFRPVTFFSLAMNWMVARYRPFGYHLVNLLLEAGVVVLVLLVLRKLLEAAANRDFISFVATMVFAAHPIHTEAVSSIVGRSELLAAGFLLLAWLFHLEDHYFLALLSFVVALLSKESAIGLLPLVLAGDYGKGRMKPWTRYAGIAALTLLYVGLLWKIEGGRFGAASVSVLDNPLSLLPPGIRILNALRIAWKYVGLLTFPLTLSCDYSYNQITLYANARHLLLPTLAALAAMVLWIWTVSKRNTALLLAGTVYFTGFATTSNVLTLTGTIFGERLAYFPSIGFCLLAASCLAWFGARSRSLTWALLSMVLLAASTRAILRNRDWRDNTSLYLAAADAAPNSAKMRAFRGMVYMWQGQWDRSRTDLEAALAISPDYPDAIEAMGLLELRTGQQNAALSDLQKALAVSRTEDFDYDYRAANLAALQIEMGKLDDAMKLLNRRIAVSPNYSRLWSNRAALHFRLGQFSEAREDAGTALRLDASNAQARGLFLHLAGGGPR